MVIAKRPALRGLPGGVVALIVLATLLVACDSDSATPAPSRGTAQTMNVTSSAFASQQPIPKKYSCDGQSISPPLQWDEPPEGTKSLALIMDDPDAPSGTFVHWVLYGLPPTTRSLPEGASASGGLPGGSLQGRSSAGTPGYTGPCPPSGTHHYHFKLYALDSNIDIASGADKAQLERAMDKHVLAYGELVGTFSR